VVGIDWHRKIDKQFMEDLGKRRKYDCKSVVDLLRAIRNKKHHIHDLPPNLRRLFGNLPDGFLTYFTLRFPKLFLHTYEVVDSFAILKSEAMFAPYFVPVSDEM
jgi:serine/threonine-protein kinase/endoribonuclease IRE1